MIKIEETETYGWEAAIRGMRNPMNSWDKSDSGICYKEVACHSCNENRNNCAYNLEHDGFVIGDNDLDLMHRLCAAGSDHRKFMRMIAVSCDITAPLYWWKEFDTYKVGTVANSCSTMHKIQAKEFTLDDFSHEHLEENPDPDSDNGRLVAEPYDTYADDAKYTHFKYATTFWPKDILELTINGLNTYRNAYLETKDKKYWWQMIQLLPSSYNQKRTVMLNYEVLNNIYTSRRNHKLDEWHDFCDWAKALPHSKLITGRADISDDFGEITRSCFEPTDEPIARAILTGEQMPEAKVVYKDALSEK